MTTEKRKVSRITFTSDVLINDSIKARALNLSERGIYVHTGRHFSPQSMVIVSFDLGKDTLKFKARVHYSQQSIGMGLTFCDLTPAEKFLLKRYIEDVPDTSESRNKVLLVDDNVMNRNIYKSKLVLEGFCVFEAANEKNALEILHKDKIDLLILNPYLAKDDGFGLLATIGENPDWKHVTLLILAPRSTPEHIEKATKAGVVEFMLKMSTSPAKLSERAKFHLGKTDLKA